MADRRILTPEVLRQLLRYEPETGKLFWRERGVEWFRDGYHPATARRGIWNTRYAGGEALTQSNRAGYRVGSVLDIKIMAHRVAYSMFHDIHIEDIRQIDHINGRTADNRMGNLRHVSCTENQRNRQINRRSSSGVTGVAWDASHNRWLAYINVDRRMKNLGRFVSIEDARAVRKDAEQQYGFHPNHGRERVRKELA